MNRPLRQLLLPVAIAWLCTFQFDAVAQQTPQTPQVEAPSPESPSEPVEAEAQPAAPDDAATVPEEPARVDRTGHRHGDNVILHIGNDSHLPAGQWAEAVISVFGSSTSEGEVEEAVVSVFGNTRVTGPTGQGAIAVFGDTYVNSAVGEAAIAVFGNLELGPQAEIDGDAVAVGGSVIRDPQAVVRGNIEEVSFGGGLGRMEGLRLWIKRCLLYGRPLALEPGLGWAWGIALGFLALYVLIALLFGSGVEKCVATLEKQPGQSVIASVLAMVLTPVLMLLLLATIVGIALIPFIGMALFCAGLFGKSVILAALGRRVTVFTGIGAFSHIAFATLIGGIILLALYIVPVIGFVAYKLTGVLGLGVVVYTLLLAARSRRVNGGAAAAAPGTPAPSVAGLTGTVDEGATPHSAEPASAEAASTASTASAAPGASAAPAAPATAATALPRAGFWIRMGALLIDIVLISIILGILQSPGEVVLVALAAYGAVMWKLKSTTVGGIVCNLRVARLDGREISWDTAIVRALSCFLSLAFAFLGFFWIAFDEERQSWHDKIAGTIVVRVPRGTTLV